MSLFHFELQIIIMNWEEGRFHEKLHSMPYLSCLATRKPPCFYIHEKPYGWECCNALMSRNSHGIFTKFKKYAFEWPDCDSYDRAFNIYSSHKQTNLWGLCSRLVMIHFSDGLALSKLNLKLIRYREFHVENEFRMIQYNVTNLRLQWLSMIDSRRPSVETNPIVVFRLHRSSIVRHAGQAARFFCKG